MRGIYKAGNGKYKIGIHGPAVHKTYAEAKSLYLNTKVSNLKKAMQKILTKRNK